MFPCNCLVTTAFKTDLKAKDMNPLKRPLKKDRTSLLEQPRRAGVENVALVVRALSGETSMGRFLRLPVWGP